MRRDRLRARWNSFSRISTRRNADDCLVACIRNVLKAEGFRSFGIGISNRDAAMTSIYKSESGQINAICDKWFLKPIPATLEARARAQHSIEEKHRYA